MKPPAPLLNYDTPYPLIQRLAQIQLALACVWLTLLSYLSYQGAVGMEPAWAILSGYLPLQVLTHWFVVKRNTGSGPLFMLLAMEAQLVTGLLFFTGGITNPLISYFLILLIMGAYGLPIGTVVWLTLLCIGDYSLLSAWYQPVLLPPQLPGLHSSLANWHLSGMWLTFVISAIIVTVVIPPLIKIRQQQAKEVQRLREQQLKNEQLIGIGTLAASTAHDMGTPLMTMSMLLDDLISQPQDEELREDLELLQHQVTLCRKSLSELAEQGRNARFDTRKQHPPRVAKEWLNQQLQRWHLSHPKAIWQTFESTATVTQEEKSHDGDHLIPTSPLLDQALLNLLDNAAEAGEQPIQIATRFLPEHWQIDIVQPDPPAADSINNYQLYQSQKPTGLGMGLFLSNASIEQFGGSIELQQRPEGGSLCQLTLPLIRPGKA